MAEGIQRQVGEKIMETALPCTRMTVYGILRCSIFLSIPYQYIMLTSSQLLFPPYFPARLFRSPIPFLPPLPLFPTHPPSLSPLFPPFFHNEVFFPVQKSRYSKKELILISVFLMEMASQDASVVISEQLPIIQAGEQKSTQNRLSKFLHRISQNEWISEFDLFSIPLKLNFNGEDTYKTEFGGCMYLLVGVCCIILTVIMQFPNGLQINSPITYYSVVKDVAMGQTLFDHSDSFLRLYFFNAATQQKASGAMFNLISKGVSIYHVTNGAATKLQTVRDSTTGDVYFNKTSLNSQATIFGNPAGSNYAKLHIEVAYCGFTDTDPVVGGCIPNIMSWTPVIEVTNFMETTGGLTPKYDKLVLSVNQDQKVTVNGNEYTTNNPVLGYLANILSYVINFYEVSPTPTITTGYTRYDTSLGCMSTSNPMGKLCSVLEFTYSGTTNKVTQNFDDITAPILFFLSISQTLFYIIYLLLLKNYANNALKLRIADTLVYVSDPSGRHHNFKSGPAVFFACLIHRHAFFQMLDKVLYSLFQTHYRKIMPEKMQLTMDMIDYGEKCLDERQFFGEINEIYSQENVQPVKIIVDLEEDGSKEEIEEKESAREKEEEEEPDHYFDDEISEQAFKRMCEEHEFYSVERKKYLKELLLENDKKYKLVLITQEIFENYKRQLQTENHTKELELPIKFEQNEELSGHNLKKDNFY